MFEVTGAEIQQLDDVQLRTLIARLAIAELRSKNFPVSGVTAGGDQNAADGGVDVRVELPDHHFSDDFIPCVPLGIQVKKPDMPKAAILSEMKPNGSLRSVIGELADAEGGYIIASSSGSLADKPLGDRRNAMRSALAGHPKADDLHTDFYDRDRLATWVNLYPGVAAWVRGCVGRPLTGWQAMGDWSGTRIGGDGAFISDDTACLLIAGSKEQTVLPIIDGIQAIRASLAEPGQCIRLIGMSGLGKTRLVQALFESDVGLGLRQELAGDREASFGAVHSRIVATRAFRLSVRDTGEATGLLRQKAANRTFGGHRKEWVGCSRDRRPPPDRYRAANLEEFPAIKNEGHSRENAQAAC